MNALLYIIYKSVKNSLLELLKKPGKLVLYILAAAIIVSGMVLPLISKNQAEAPAPIFWFTGILFLFISLFVVTSLSQGLSGGNAIFEMNDVNLLFISPVNPQKILLYGIIRIAKTAFAAGFFILFQSSSLARFGIGYGGVLLTFGGFLSGMVSLTTASLLIYIVTHGSESRKRLVKCFAVLLFSPLAVYTVLQYFTASDLSTALKTAIESPFLRFTPVAGWIAEGVTAFLSGDLSACLLMFGLNLLLCAGMILYIMRANPDYYEDVLVATETAYEKKQAIAEGKLDAASFTGKAVKITNTGIPGKGAAALFGKHTRESFRQNRFGFLTLSSVITVTGAVVLSAIAKDFFLIVQILFWVQTFLIGTGRGLKETFTHYIYLIPEPSFKKILWSNMEVMARTLIESILIFGIAGFLLNTPITNILVCIAAYTLFSFLLLGVNYLSMRLTGADLSVGMMVLIYYLAVALVMLPGVVLAIASGMAVGGNAGYFTGLLVLSAWELVAGSVCFMLAKGVLHNCDMSMMKTNR